MSQITYLNGQFIPHEKAYVHIEDRGYQFADGVYEVIAVAKGYLVDGEPHLERLERSLGELRIDAPMSRDELRDALRELVRRNEMQSGTVYMQITRGVATRDHPFPKSPSTPTVVLTVNPFEFPEPEDVSYATYKVITIPDIRWGRSDIKSVSLLANCLAKQAAREADAYEAVMYDKDGMITEGSSSNAWIVDGDGTVLTRPRGNDILAGISRGRALELLEKDGIPVVERSFSVEEFKGAREVFLSSTRPLIKPIGRVDDTVIGDGEIGPITRRLLDAYRRRVFAMNGDT